MIKLKNIGKVAFLVVIIISLIFLISSNQKKVSSIEQELIVILENEGVNTGNDISTAVYILSVDNFNCYSCSGYQGFKQRGSDVVFFVPDSFSEIDLENFRYFNQIEDQHRIIPVNDRIKNVVKAMEISARKNRQAYWLFVFRQGKTIFRRGS